MCFWGYGPSLWFLGHRPSILTCLVCFSVRICPKRTWGMIFMILSLRLFPSRWDHLLCKPNKQTTSTTTTTIILTNLSKRKVSSWRNFQPEGTMMLNFPRWTPLFNFGDRHYFIKERLKSTAIPLVFNTKYNRNFPGKYIRQALLKHWNIIDKNVRLKMIFPTPLMIAYSRSEYLRDPLVRLNSLPGRRVTTRMTIFWEMRKILHPHQPCKHFKIWSLRAKVSTCS